MKRLIFILVISSHSFSDQIIEKFQAANARYNDSDYIGAIQLYEEIVSEKLQSGYLYYNLGNSYFRAGMIGQSIWAYNKALKLSPRFENIIYNLEIANSKIKDRVTLPPEFFLVDLYIQLKNYFTFFEWFFLCGLIVFLSAGFFMLSKVLILNSNVVRRLILILFFSAFVLHLIAFDIFLEDSKETHGIIIFDDVHAFSGPFQGESTKLFILNEGTRVSVLQNQGSWVEIVILSGEKAWIPIEKIKVI